MSTDTLGTLAERAARGAAFLDEHEPGWASRINLDCLAMSICDRCILGQLYGSYMDGSRTFSRGETVWAARHGFTFRFSEDFSWDTLANAWRAEIRKRLDAEATS